MKTLALGFVAFLLLSVRPTNSVYLEIDGFPLCLKKNKTYTIRILSPGELPTDEYYKLTGNGIALTGTEQSYIYKGTTGSSHGKVKLSVSIQNDKKHTSEKILAHEISVCN